MVATMTTVLLVSIVNGADGAAMIRGLVGLYPFAHLAIRTIYRAHGRI